MNNVVRGLAVFLVWFFLAPMIASILIVIAIFATSPASDSGGGTTGLLYAGFGLLLGYSLGALPAIVTGAIAAFGSRHVRQGWLWVGLSTVIGAGLAWLFGFSNWANLPLKPQDLQIGLLLFGGVTSLLCALICVAFRPRQSVPATPAGSASPP